MFHAKVDESRGLKEVQSRGPAARALQRDNSTQAQNEGFQLEDDDESSVVSRLPTGSTVARDLATTASSGPREFLNFDKDAEAQEWQELSGGGGRTPSISELHNVTENAYGGGIYGSDESTLTDRDRNCGTRGVVTEESNISSTNSRASDSQSVDGGPHSLPARREIEAPVSSGRRDIDVTGQSYIG